MAQPVPAILWHYISHLDEQSIGYMPESANFGLSRAIADRILVKMG